MTSRHLIVRTTAPAPFTLATMGRTATAASDTWTFRQWAARLATRAPPRDYRAQLRALYDGVLERWRYVAEPDEWIHSSPRSLIAHVLGVEYNTLPTTDPTRVDLARIPSTHKGWGDCDDVSTVVAAGVRALGMTPYFRVTRRGTAGHVAVLARTPRGELVSVDPVGHPEHRFGWAQDADQVELWNMDGQPVDLSIERLEQHLAPFLQPKGPAMYGRSTALALGHLPSPSHQTMLGGLDARGITFRTAANAPHYCRTIMGDCDGPRVLAVPMRHLRLLKRGVVSDGIPAIDERGRQYFYHAGHDLWIDQRLAHTPLGRLPESMGGIRDWFKKLGRRIKGAFKKVGRFIRRVGKKIVKAARWVASKVMGSKVVQKIVGGILQMYGIPSRLTQGVLAGAASFISQGGIMGFIRALRKGGKKMAFAMLAKAGRAGLQRAGVMAGPDDASAWAPVHELYQGGRVVPVQPVMGMVGVPGADELGALEIQDEPQRGHWYRVRKGDTLTTIAGKAGASTSKLRYALAKDINNARANAPYFDRRLTDNLFPAGKLNFDPDWDCGDNVGATGRCYPVIWIPAATGDEPAEQLPEPTPGPVPGPEQEIPPEQPMPEQPMPEPPMPPTTPPMVAEEVPPEPEPEPVDLPPSKAPDPFLAERASSCRASGGTWIEPGPGEGEPYCDLAPEMPPESPLEPIPTPTAPPMPPVMPPAMSEADRCRAAGGYWSSSGCITAGMCRDPSTFSPETGCGGAPSPMPPELEPGGGSPVEPIPTPTAPPPAPMPTAGGGGIGMLPLVWMMLSQ